MNRTTRRALAARLRRAKRRGDHQAVRKLEAVLEAAGASLAEQVGAALDLAGITLSTRVDWGSEKK